ncbi:MAG: hypothetical protein ACE5HW_00045 [Candidatus Methanofastidiosia archaeon]
MFKGYIYTDYKNLNLQTEKIFRSLNLKFEKREYPKLTTKEKIDIEDLDEEERKRYERFKRILKTHYLQMSAVKSFQNTFFISSELEVELFQDGTVKNQNILKVEGKKYFKERFLSSMISFIPDQPFFSSLGKYVRYYFENENLERISNVSATDVFLYMYFAYFKPFIEYFRQNIKWRRYRIQIG